MSKEKAISKDVFDYKNIDEIGLRNYIKAIDFQSSVFTQPIKEQANEMTEILQSALKKFVPIKKIIIKPSDQPWVNSYTRLLMRKKNRNYHLYKKISFEYLNMESHKRPSPVSKKRKIKPSENQNIQQLNPKRQICV